MLKKERISHRAAQILTWAVVFVLCLGVTTLFAQEETPETPDQPLVDEYGVPLEASIVEQTETPTTIQTITEIPVRRDTFATSGIPEGLFPQAYTNYGSRQDLRLGYRTADSFGAQRIYLWFDIAGSGIPSNATIRSATIRIWTSDSAGNMGFEARHLSSSWDEYTLTWLTHRPQWGGSLGTGTISAGAGEKTGDATALVREWVSGAHPNNGIIIIGNEGTTNPFERVFFAREAANGLYARLMVDWSVPVDTTPPESTITQLPTFSRSDFTVSWTGTDFGSPATGIAFWDVDFSTDGVNWSQWLRGTTNQSANWQGAINGITYHFRVRAVDRAGNVESWTRNPSQQQTSTLADTAAPIVTLNSLPQFTYDSGFPITWTGNDSTSGIVRYEIQFNVDDGPWQFGETLLLGNGTFTRYATGAVNEEKYGIRIRATDQAGNTGVWSNETFTTVYLTPPYPDTRVLPFVPMPPDDAPGISRSTTFRMTWATQAAPGTAVINQYSVRYSCDGGAWTQWRTDAPGTFADFDSTVNNSGCDSTRDVHLYQFEASGKVQYPNEVRSDAWTQNAEAYVVVDPMNLMEIMAYMPIIMKDGGGTSLDQTAVQSGLQFSE